MRGVPQVVEVADDHVWVDPPRAWSRRGGWVAAGVAGVLAVGVVCGTVRGSWGTWMFVRGTQVLLWGSFALQGLVRWGTLVDARGVHRPWRRVLPWSQVAAVPAPARFDQRVRPRLVDGRSVGIGVPVAHAAAGARIGGVPFEGEPTRDAPAP